LPAFAGNDAGESGGGRRKKIPLRQYLAFLDRRLVEGVDPEQVGGDDRLRPGERLSSAAGTSSMTTGSGRAAGCS